MVEERNGDEKGGGSDEIQSSESDDIFGVLAAPRVT